MRLFLAVVQAEDADMLLSRFSEAGLRATRINSVGSFLARGNVTVLAGLDEGQVDDALAIVRATCHTRKSYVNAATAVQASGLPLAVPLPIEVQIGGAVVMSFPVSRMVHIPGDLPSEDAGAVNSDASPDAETAAEEPPEGMMLVLAILQADDADPVVRALLAAGYRVTRLSSAGGFFRRGNVTLLIGVKCAEIDAVIEVIRANVRAADQSALPEAERPAYRATIFVLQADQFVRV
jgi:uncharacterized protein YaaQ